MNEDQKLNNIIKKGVYLLILVLIGVIIFLLILKYNVEGERNMPFELTEMITVSTAEGYQEKQDEENNWNIEVYQSNDIYLNIKENRNSKQTESIKKIVIENLKVDHQPEIGEIYFYRAVGNDETSYIYQEQYEIKDKVIYEGDIKSDLKNLKISNQGGTIIFRAINKTGKKYISNDNILTHDGRLLNRINVSFQQIKAVISFDMTITLASDISYKANITLELPTGDITKEGISNTNKTDKKDIIFKRE